VIRRDEIWVIDYKTAAAGDTRSELELLGYYKPQLEYYAQGLRKIWPGKTVRQAILLTGTQALLEIERQKS
jgi:ATP-dependent helicase/nuclease subunit A